MATLTLKYDAALDYQRDAIAAAVDLFDGQPPAEATFRASLNTGASLLTEYGVGNELKLDDTALLTNLQTVQHRNHIDHHTGLGARNFTVEMETGTGKTYVYLRSAFELQRTYGFSKFVIVVPSVAIREGVLHSLTTMADHFRALYSVPFDHAIYDSRQLGRLRSFATANTLQFMVINIQAFQRDIRDGDIPGSANVIYRENDRLSGHRPIDFLRSTRPIVILDEPQKLSGAASVQAIGQLHPLCTFQYSATPVAEAVRIYRLGPIEAYDRRLVKRIEVASVREESNANDAFVRLLSVDASKQTARVRMNVGTGSVVREKDITIRKDDDLFLKSQGGKLDAGRQEYRVGFRVEEIGFRPGESYVAFGNGRRVALGQAAGDQDAEVMQAQVYATVREHLEKERRLRPLGIKVLSLFFIDRVANYRVYGAGGSYTLGRIGRWFEKAFADLSVQDPYAGLIADPVHTIHAGYFATDRKGAYRESTERGNKEDEGAYEVIMQDKERLLSLEEPLRFIFSHSALREGWDNPNVFQICTLNETRSVSQKRQEIGRGLRLPVNASGERVRDEQINRLTVIANESYRDFASGLQQEYEAAGVQFGVIHRHDFAHLPRTDTGRSETIGYEKSAEIWEALLFKHHIDEEGRIQRSFDPKATMFEVLSDDQFKHLAVFAPQVIDRMSQAMITSRLDDARERRLIRVQDNVIDSEEFGRLWRRISQRTHYSIEFDTADLIESAVANLKRPTSIQPPRITVDTRELEMSRKGIAEDSATLEIYDRDIAPPTVIPDILAYLQNETDLTRDTLVEILLQSGRLPELLINPQAFITMATREIKAAVSDLTVRRIAYTPIGNDTWSLSRLREESATGIETYLSRLYQLKHSSKSPYEYIVYDSRVEEQFAAALDASDQVQCFIKLPAWYTVDTPVGTYNPDWAISIRDDDRVYLVRETKGTADTAELRPAEQQKIACARRHFEAIEVDYAVTTDVNSTIRDALAAARHRAGRIASAEAS